jgi:CBS domain-containing protein
MLVKEAMCKTPDAVTERTTLKQAAEEMQKHDFGFLPVKQNSHVVGAVTDRDIIVRAIAKGLDPNKATLKEVMSKNIYFCHENDDIKIAAKQMSEKKVNRLAVYDQKDQLSGVISIGDIARKCHDTALCGKLAEAIHRE